MASFNISQEDARKYGVLAVFALTIVVGIGAIWLGMRVDQQFTAAPGEFDVCETLDTCTPADAGCEKDSSGKNTGYNCTCQQTGEECCTDESCGTVRKAYVASCQQDTNACPTAPALPQCSNTDTCTTLGNIGCETNASGQNTGYYLTCIQSSTQCTTGSSTRNAYRMESTPNATACPTTTPTTPTTTSAPSTTSTPSTSSSASSSPTTPSDCGATGKDNGCTCQNSTQCDSGYCNPNNNTCTRPPECSGSSNRPNGCQCGQNSVCASGFCNTAEEVPRCRPTAGCDTPTGRVNGCACNNDSRCASNNCDELTRTCRAGSSGGGGNLPATGLFDEDSRPLLVGLTLLLLGLVIYMWNKPRHQPQVQQVDTHRYLDDQTTQLINTGIKQSKQRR
jgi:hypothetical protein